MGARSPARPRLRPRRGRLGWPAWLLPRMNACGRSSSLASCANDGIQSAFPQGTQKGDRLPGRPVLVMDHDHQTLLPRRDGAGRLGPVLAGQVGGHRPYTCGLEYPGELLAIADILGMIVRPQLHVLERRGDRTEGSNQPRLLGSRSTAARKSSDLPARERSRHRRARRTAMQFTIPGKFAVGDQYGANALPSMPLQARRQASHGKIVLCRVAFVLRDTARSRPAHQRP